MYVVYMCTYVVVRFIFEQKLTSLIYYASQHQSMRLDERFSSVISDLSYESSLFVGKLNLCVSAQNDQSSFTLKCVDQGTIHDFFVGPLMKFDRILTDTNRVNSGCRFQRGTCLFFYICTYIGDVRSSRECCSFFISPYSFGYVYVPDWSLRKR